ncbi:MAG: hypothetical protein VX571_03545 [Candidatus Thermoplasmatota archaeon]|nr:hypothetical protein [Candidatus Thermoplasmatota archaeon]
MGSFQYHPFLPDNMEVAVRDLLENRAVRLRPSSGVDSSHDFVCIGIAERIPDLESSDDREVYVWHVPSGLLPLTEQDLERWRVDAPVGRHWILSERSLPSDANLIGMHDVVLWGPDTISTWIGGAVLSGDLVARIPDVAPRIDFLATELEDLSKEEPTTSLRPLIDPANWLAQRGMEGAVATPVFLKARMWTVNGELVGPSMELERGRWFVIEDPWSASLNLLDPLDRIDHIPNLRVILPIEESWLSETRLSTEIQNLLEVRKKGSVENANLSGPVRSMLLETWSFSYESANYQESALLIPGWIIHTTEEKILHGRNGRTYDMVASSSATT